MKKLSFIFSLSLLTLSINAEYLYKPNVLKGKLDEYIGEIESRVDERFEEKNFIVDENNVTYSWDNPSFNGNFTSSGTYYYKFITAYCQMTFTNPVEFFESGYNYNINRGMSGSHPSGAQRYMVTYSDKTTNSDITQTGIIEINKPVKSVRWYFVSGIEYQFFNNHGNPGTADNVSLEGKKCIKIYRSPK